MTNVDRLLEDMTATRPEKNVEGVWAYLVPDADGEEIIATALYHGHRIPLVAATPAKLQAFAGFAEQVAKTTGFTVRLAYFGKREDMASVSPAGRS